MEANGYLHNIWIIYVGMVISRIVVTWCVFVCLVFYLLVSRLGEGRIQAVVRTYMIFIDCYDPSCCLLISY